MTAYYRQDMRKLSFVECWTGTHTWHVVILWIAKILRISIPLPGGTQIPRSLREMQVREEDMPPLVRARLAASVEELAQLGFVSPFSYSPKNLLKAQEIGVVMLRHRSGEAKAAVIHVSELSVHPPIETHFVSVVTSMHDDRTLETTSQMQYLAEPANNACERIRGASPRRLWDRHQERLRQLAHPIMRIETRDAMIDFQEGIEQRAFEFHVKRGLFVPMTEEEVSSALARAEELMSVTVDAPGESEAGASQGDVPSDEMAAMPERSPLDQEQSTPGEPVVELFSAIPILEPAKSNPTAAAILQQIDRIQNKSTGPRAFFLMLLISTVLFLAAGAAWWTLGTTLAFILVLLFHELGHYVTMRILKYRNLRILLIPLLGAAVTGHHFNVPGWKKAIVSLMGPLPGIALGVVLGTVSVIAQIDWLSDAAVLLLILNALNLLPFLPLDGGWVMHAVLFCRHEYVDVVFRIAGVIALLASAVYLDFWLLMILAALILIDIPRVLYVARIARSLSGRGVAAKSPDDVHISPDAVITIVDEIGRSSGNAQSRSSMAALTLRVFERLNARPPGWWASLGFLAVQAAAFLVAAVSVVGLIAMEDGGLTDFFAAAPDIEHPITIDRSGFTLDYPGNWWVDEDEDDYDPDAEFSIEPIQYAVVYFYVADEFADPSSATTSFLESYKAMLPGDGETSFEKWGRCTGVGVAYVGVWEGNPCRVRIFSASTDARSLTVVEYSELQIADEIEPGFELIRGSFRFKAPSNAGG